MMRNLAMKLSEGDTQQKSTEKETQGNKQLTEKDTQGNKILTGKDTQGSCS